MKLDSSVSFYCWYLLFIIVVVLIFCDFHLLENIYLEHKTSACKYIHHIYLINCIYILSISFYLYTLLDLIVIVFDVIYVILLYMCSAFPVFVETASSVSLFLFLFVSFLDTTFDECKML